MAQFVHPHWHAYMLNYDEMTHLQQKLLFSAVSKIFTKMHLETGSKDALAH